MLNASGHYESLSFSPVAFIDRAVGEMIYRFADRLPDLSFLTVLLPNVHAAAGFKRALRLAVNCEVLLLPRFTTFSALAEAVPLERPIASPSLRLVQLYSALKARDWFDSANLWRVSTELAQLFDSLTLAQQTLPNGVDEFVAFLEKSYQAKADTAMRFEARLVHEMWYAFNRSEAIDPNSPLTAAAGYGLRLAAWAQKSRGPLCVVGIEHFAPVEAAFLHQYAERQPVLVLNTKISTIDPPTACLAEAWADDGNGGPSTEAFRERAKRFGEHHLRSPLSALVKLYAANSMEDEAATVAHQVKTWLAEGKREIVLVAIDRLSARRVRALLERSDILLADESGWTLSTTSASTVIMRLIETVSDGFYHRDVLDLIKSPFFAADWSAERRKRAVHRLEEWVRENNIVAGLERYRVLVAKQAPHGDEEEIIERLGRAEAVLKGNRHTIAHWIGRLLNSLDNLGATQGLNADAAGRQLLMLLAQRQLELIEDQERIGLSEWRHWLNAEFEAATFRDASIVSPIALTALSATRLRQFEATVLIGADATHLSSRSADFRIFNQSVHRDLSLPGSMETAAEIQADLIGLIARSGSVLITWQASKSGEHNALSPWFARLEAFHLIAHGESLMTRSTGATSMKLLPTFKPVAAPNPSIEPQLLPLKISASAYGSLMACPYQFFARHILGLNQQDDVAEEMEKRNYGELVHETLARFHEEYPVLSGLDNSVAEAGLRRITDEVFSSYIENNYTSIAWKFRWEKRISSYLTWHREWESEGWRFDSAEKKFERSFALDHGFEVVLHGRLDRIDRNSVNGNYAVLDYKTQRRKPLQDKLIHPGEDVQLAVYALLLGDGTADAAYISLDDEKVSAVTVGQTLPILAADAGARLNELFNSMAQGAPLPANGAPSACQYCEMRGLCRLDYWDLDK